jgi:hypothetical protein
MDKIMDLYLEVKLRGREDQELVHVFKSYL